MKLPFPCKGPSNNEYGRMPGKLPFPCKGPSNNEYGRRGSKLEAMLCHMCSVAENSHKDSVVLVR